MMNEREVYQEDYSIAIFPTGVGKYYTMAVPVKEANKILSAPKKSLDSVDRTLWLGLKTAKQKNFKVSDEELKQLTKRLIKDNNGKYKYRGILIERRRKA